MAEVNMTNRIWGESSEVRSKRLKKSGLWDEFKDERTRLKDSGLTDRKCMKVMEGKYGPDVTTAINRGVEEKAKESSGGPTQDDLNWVYQNYANEKVGPKNAPSSGAWGMLKVSRESTKVYESVIAALTPKTFVSEHDGSDDEAIELTGLAENGLGEFKQQQSA